MTKYILVKVINRETTVTVYDTLAEAKEQMKEQFYSVIEAEQEEELYSQLNDEDAYIDSDFELNCNWTIHRIEMNDVRTGVTKLITQ